MRCYDMASEAAEDKVAHIITWAGKARQVTPGKID
jgi:hypothetical protein